MLSTRCSLWRIDKLTRLQLAWRDLAGLTISSAMAWLAVTLPAKLLTGTYWAAGWARIASYSVTISRHNTIRPEPARISTSASASSRPDEMPPPVRRLPSTTKRGWPRATLTFLNLLGIR